MLIVLSGVQRRDRLVREKPPRSDSRGGIRSAKVATVAAVALALICCSKAVDKPEPEPVPPAPQKGNLEVKSEPPGATIFLDGQNTGEVTPQQQFSIWVNWGG